MMPKDPVMLLSYVNTQLRDFYPSLAEFCAAMQTEESDLRENWRSSTMSTMRKRTSLYKNNQALKKWRKKAFRMWKNTYGAPFYAKRVSYN